MKFPLDKITQTQQKPAKSLPDKHRQHNGGPMLEVGESKTYTAVNHIRGGEHMMGTCTWTHLSQTNGITTPLHITHVQC